MKATWDARYQSTEYQYGINPNDFFAEQIANIPVGRILIPAAGEGRDAQGAGCAAGRLIPHPTT